MAGRGDVMYDFRDINYIVTQSLTGLSGSLTAYNTERPLTATRPLSKEPRISLNLFNAPILISDPTQNIRDSEKIRGLRMTNLQGMK